MLCTYVHEKLKDNCIFLLLSLYAFGSKVICYNSFSTIIEKTIISVIYILTLIH